jgi:ABC-type uncharacterized transport system substrate-binding protein
MPFRVRAGSWQLLLTCLWALVALVWASPAPAQSKPPKRIYIVQSQEIGHPCGQPQADGVLESLASAGWVEGRNLTVRGWAMDMYRTNVTRASLERVAADILRDIEAFKPDLVFALDDAAIRFVMMPLVGRNDLPIVFSGMNAQPELYNGMRHFINTRARPGGNVTGVYEKLYLAQSVKVMQHAVPELRGNKVVMITDATLTGDALTRQFEIELADTRDVRWEVRRVRTFNEYTALIRSLNDDPDVKAIYPIAMSVDGGGRPLTFAELYDWTLAHSRKPEMAPHYFFTRMGLFGGAVVNFGAMGRLAGQKGAMVLGGTKAGDIPIDDAREYAIVFNVKRARDLGIEIPAHVLTAADYIYKDDLLPLRGKQLVYDPRIRSF